VLRCTGNKELTISVEDQQRAMARPQRCANLLWDLLVLWVENKPGKNRLDRGRHWEFSMTFAMLRSNDLALSTLAEGVEVYRPIISDSKRTPGIAHGLDLLNNFGRRGRLPDVPQNARVDPDMPVTCGAFGLIDRPDGLLHIIIDVLERLSGVFHHATAAL
jgi:hypothetical protein